MLQRNKSLMQPCCCKVGFNVAVNGIFPTIFVPERNNASCIPILIIRNVKKNNISFYEKNITIYNS